MKIKKLIAAVLFLCLAFSVASAQVAPIPLDAKNGTPPAADGFLSATEYQDESMTVTIEAHQVGATTCHVARVKIADPSQLRSASAYGFNRPQTEMTNTIARRVKEIAMQKNIIAEKNRQINSYKRALGRPAGDSSIAPWSDGSVEARSRLVGKVIEVHDKYGYIAVDIGKGSTVVQEIGNRKLEVNAGVKKGLDFIVARGSMQGKSDFVARVVIDEVGEFCSTANITPGAAQIKVGDIVYWSSGK